MSNIPENLNVVTEINDIKKEISTMRTEIAVIKTDIAYLKQAIETYQHDTALKMDKMTDVLASIQEELREASAIKIRINSLEKDLNIQSDQLILLSDRLAATNNKVVGFAAVFAGLAFCVSTFGSSIISFFMGK